MQITAFSHLPRRNQDTLKSKKYIRNYINQRNFRDKVVYSTTISHFLCSNYFQWKGFTEQSVKIPEHRFMLSGAKILATKSMKSCYQKLLSGSHFPCLLLQKVTLDDMNRCLLQENELFLFPVS